MDDPEPQKRTSPLDYLPSFVSATAAIGGASIVLGMFGNTCRFIAAGAIDFVSALTLDDHISTAGTILPFVAIYVLVMWFVGLDENMKDKISDSGKEDAELIGATKKPRSRLQTLRQSWPVYGASVMMFFIFLISPVSIAPMPLGIVLGACWVFPAISIARRLNPSNRTLAAMIFVAGVIVVIVAVLSVKDGLVARYREGISHVTLKDGKTESGNVLFVGSRGTVLTSIEQRPRFISSDQISKIEIGSAAVVRIPNVICVISGYDCRGMKFNSN